MSTRKIEERQADSREWNARRNMQLKDLQETGTLADVSKEFDLGDGWYVVSRHAGGSHAAYVTQNKLRKVHPGLEFRVVNTKDDDSVLWDAVIHARRKVAE